MPFVSIRYVQPLKHSFGAIASQSTKAAITIRLGMGQGRRTTMEATMYNTSPGWGLVLRADPLWLQTRLQNKMQVCCCQLPMYCLMLLWRRLQWTLTWWQHLNLQADFVWIVATSFLFTLWIYSVLSEHWTATPELIAVFRFLEGSTETHKSPFHTSTTRP